MMAAPEETTRRLIVLGSTGSIGINTLAVVEQLHRHSGIRFDIVGLATGTSARDVAEQACRFRVDHVAIADSVGADVFDGMTQEVFTGPDAARRLVEAVARRGDLVVGAMVGAAGLTPTVAAIERGCDLALANKETLVAAGSIVVPLAEEHGVSIIPVDSEHSAISQCLRAGRGIDEVRRVVLTASGGPFRAWTRAEIEGATVEQALEHPTWNMGAKNTIDSASMMNKALEMIEAHELFGLQAEQIEVIVHPQSIVHSFVEFVDGSVVAQMNPPDMKAPIQYALTWPHRVEGCTLPLDFDALRSLDFEPVDHDRFPAVRLAREVIRAGGTSGAIFNAANEVAVAAFLDRRIAFGSIWRIVQETLGAIGRMPVKTLDDCLEADSAARRHAEELITELSGRTPAEPVT